MDCDKFKKYIHDYFTDPDFSWELRDEIDAHYFECDKCFYTYRIAKLMSDKKVKKETVDILANLQAEKAEKLKDQGNITEAIKCYEEALELKPGDEKILQKLFEIMEDRSQKPHETEQYKEMPAFIIANLNGLTSDSFMCKTSSLGDAQYRGDAQQDQKPSKAVYTIGEPIIVSIEMPAENDGYLAVFHYDEKYNLNMLFPRETSDDTFVNAGKEIRVGLTAEKPIGRQYVKAIWTDKQAIQSAAIDFDDNESVAAAIKEFLKIIYEIDNIKWLESVKDFEIIEKP